MLAPNECSLTMFVDGTSFVKAGGRTEFLIRETGKVMTHWFDAIRLTINVDKCAAFRFGRGTPDGVQIQNNNLHCKPIVNI